MYPFAEVEGIFLSYCFTRLIIRYRFPNHLLVSDKKGDRIKKYLRNLEPVLYFGIYYLIIGQLISILNILIFFGARWYYF